MDEATYFLEMADRVFRLAKHARESTTAREEICAALEALANELMAKAVATDTSRDKATKAE